MGEIRTKVKLTNAVDEALSRRGKLGSEAIRTYEAHAVVDTGAVRSIIPVHVLEKLGLAIRGNRVAEYAVGRKESVGVTEPVIIEMEGRKLDLLADCTNRKVIPNPAHPDQPVSKVK